MDETAFWEIVDTARDEAGGDATEQAEAVVERLTGLDPEAVTDFARHFEARFDRTYRWDLWGAADLMLGGAGDDAFDAFRCWLIGQGRRVFEGALADPDALAGLLPGFDPEHDGDAEELGDAAADAYERLTGGRLPALGLPAAPAEPEGDPLDFEDAELMAARFPALWALFG
jgi:hypothetical protein